ncbi:sucrose-phosphate phosphatase [Sphaerospermopsis aphanizomenoides BCCUSP55]|uniref:sucrose-phosphate phosphatase n=1 Tax=Sphaerospermopsis aphanizomenoides TaxID=459663 RepID=UPI000A7D1944|nr:sucrose-phosphate phosphatase [Sphaerospermopsis aphanizomenoides]MBK1989582.1 sucrose-phosphate phosphatase [Sphaerospermopsis aphanizomenoides BCCUSP55]
MTKFLFVTDLDHTFVDHTSGCEDKARIELSDRLQRHRQQHGTKLVYSTGRSPTLYQELQQEKNLFSPDALVLSVGTEIYLDGSATTDPEWDSVLSAGWNRDKILAVTKKFPELEPQPDSEQRPFKVSFFVQEEALSVLPQLQAELENRNLSIKLIYSGGIDLDILPLTSDKGQAMQFLRRKWKFAAEQTVVCGDSGNDIALFAVGNERGIIVGNAQKELLQWHNQNPAAHRYLAQNFYAAGIMEGLYYFGFLS